MGSTMEPARRRQLTSVDEYLEGEQRSDVRHEYVGGEVFAMAGTSDAHNVIAGNVYTLLRNALRGGPCRVYFADVKVHVAAAQAFYYPDVVVTCDPRDTDTRYYKSHPKVVVEVLSDSTAAHDRGEKFRNYRRLDSFEEYLLVDSERHSVELFRRNATGRFELFSFEADAEVPLGSIGVSLPVRDLYADVDLPPHATTGAGT
jgi:Uma2 family endonuclease